MRGHQGAWACMGVHGRAWACMGVHEGAVALVPVSNDHQEHHPNNGIQRTASVELVLDCAGGVCRATRTPVP
jgi:hypothetical protein